MNFVKKHKKTTIAALIVVILLGIAAYIVHNPPKALIQFMIEKGLAFNNNKTTFQDDALYVITTGTGGPLQEKGRVSAQTVVIAGDQVLVFDTGSGSTLNLELSGVDVSTIDGLFLTHYHSDHIGDMGELMLKRWASNTVTEPLAIYGPVGLEQVLTGFEDAYQLDKQYRINHHGTEMLPPEAFGGQANEFDLGTDLAASEVVYTSGDVEVIAFNVDHTPVFPAVGYRVNYKDRSVVISGDTAYTEYLADHAMDADMFVCEALNMEFSQMISDASTGMDSNLSTVAEDILDYHISPEDAAIVAQEAGVDQLVLTHVLPPIPSRILKNGYIKEARTLYDGDITIANDGTMIKLPVNSFDIKISELLQ